jgi:hypothetical protein
MHREVTIPIKCSTVKKIDNIINKINNCLFNICCGLSVIFLILFIFGVIHLKGDILDLTLFGLSCFGVYITLVIICEWAVNNFPEIKCIEDA